MIKLTLLSFWRKHKILSRFIAITMIVILLFQIFYPLYKEYTRTATNELQRYSDLIGSPSTQYASKLSYDLEKEQFVFNKDYQPGSDVSGDAGSPKISATFEAGKEAGKITVTDPENKVSVTFTPNFRVAEPKQDQNRLAYALPGKDALKVFTMKSSGVKEDIILTEKPEDDTFSLEYDLSFSDGLEARQESNGSIGVYGVASTLLGNITAGTEADQELLNKARQNGEKTQFLFEIPAPFVIEAGSNEESKNATAWFSLDGKKLTLHASGLQNARYPLTIDPTIYVETARKLMRGNNETNIDFDTSNELIQKSQTTGARIDEWSQSTDLPGGIWDQSTAVAGGNVYMAGGRSSRVLPRVVAKQTSTQSSDSTTFVMNMPAERPAGDLYIALMCHDGTINIPTAPTGWTEYADIREHAAFYKIGTDQGGGNEAASYTFTGSGSEQWAGTIIRIENFDSSDIVSGSAATGSNAGNAVPVYPAVTPDTEGSLVIRSSGFDDDPPASAGWQPTTNHSPLAADTSNPDYSNAFDCGFTADQLDVSPRSGVSSGTATINDPGVNESYQVSDTYGSSSIAINGVTATTSMQSTVRWAQFNSTTSAIDSPNPGAGSCGGWCTSASYDLPEARVGMSMVAYNGYLYALGGYDGTNYEATVWIAKLGANGEPQLWHPTGGTPTYWYASTNTLPVALRYTSIAIYNNNLYLTGGQQAAGTSVSTVRMASLLPTGDISSWTTTGMQTLPEVRHGHSVHVYNDIMYLLGGSSSGTLLNSVYYSRLDSSTGTMSSWNATSSFTTARQSLGGTMSAIWGGYVYIGGGCSTVNGSGYCTAIVDSMQLASINADGSLGPFNSMLNLKNQRFAYSFVAWQGGLYRIGGCSIQDSATGACYGSHIGAEYGVVNQDGDASTVSNSEPSGSSPCSGGSPTNCDIPPPGDTAGLGGQMSSMLVINNGYIYNIGGCTSLSGGSCNGMSGNTSFSTVNSQGQMQSPTICNGTSSGHWCVLSDSTSTGGINYQINGTAGVGAAAATVFNNTIYVIGGTNSGGTWTSTIYYVPVNPDGNFTTIWNTIATAASGLPATFQGARLDTGVDTNLGASGIGYGFAFTRANPASASSTPGHLYYLGGCVGSSSIGCAGFASPTPAYSNEVYKCNISTSRAVSGCTKTGQMQIDADNINTGNQGNGLMAGTVYANRVYLVGGACGSATGAAASDPCGSTYAANRKDTIYAKIDSSNNIVDNTTGSSSGAWAFTTGQMDPVRRRGVAFGYNGYVYSLAGYSGSASLEDLLFAKIDVSTGDMGDWSNSGVVVTPRWDLRAIVSNGYVYAVGGCAVGSAPAGCTSLQEEVQTFQLYNNDSGTPISYSASANQFTTDRFKAGSTVLNGYLYVAGGCVTLGILCTDATNSVQYSLIDSTTGALGAWAAGGNLPADRNGGDLVAVGGSLYYIGGVSDTYTDVRSEVYYSSSISSGSPTWATASNGLPAVRGNFGTTVWDDRIYVAGGGDGAVNTATVYISPKLSSGGNISSAWTTGTSFNIARQSASLVAYANNLYLLGGYDGTSFLNDVQFASIGYKTGTIGQSGTTVTGSGTSFTTAMIGSTLQYADGSTATITARSSATSITVDVSKSVTAGSMYVILDGSVGSWSYSTSLPEPIIEGDAFAVNGYIYLVGGRSSFGDCSSNTLMAPISANTTIATGNNPTGVGEWYETNVKYSGERYGNSVAYYNGKMYVTGGACQSYPTVSSITTTTFGTNATSHAVRMPAVVDAGDLLLLLFSNDGTATVTDPDGAGGWTQLGTSRDNTNAGTNMRGSVWAKDAAGTEDGAPGTVNFVTSSTEQAAAQVYRIPAAKWEGNITSVELSAPTTDAGVLGSVANPGAVTPTWGGQHNTLFIAYAAGGTYDSVTTYPTNFEFGLHSQGGTGASGASVSSARYETFGGTVDPGAFSMGNLPTWVAYTIAIRPAAAALTGANSTVQSALYSQPQVAKYSRMIDTDTDVFPTSWLMNGIDNSVGARWRVRYKSMHDINPTTGGSDSVLTTPPSTYTLQQNPVEDCGTSATMPVMTTWGQDTLYGNASLGDVATYTPFGAAYTTGTITQSGTTVTGSGTTFTSAMVGQTLTYTDGTTTTISGFTNSTSITVGTSKTISTGQTYAIAGNINCARYYFFSVSIDASQTFGYPEDVSRGPTISDLSLFFTSDPSKRLRHGKTFTGGEQQPLDTPCRQSVDAQCPLP